MAVSARTQITFWSIAFAVFLIFVWFFNSVLAPFVLGIAIAYLLDPLVRLLEKVGLRRWLSSLLMLVLFFTFLTIIILLVGPPAYRELADLVQKVPEYTDQIIEMTTPYIEMVQNKLGTDGPDQVKSLLKENAGKLFSAGSGVLAGIAGGGQALMSFLTILLVTPLVAFFVMREWPRMTAYIEDLYPKRHAATIKDLLKKIDIKIAGFVRGQLTVALVLGLVYAIVLSIVGLDYGFLIGISAGIAGIVPLVGSVLGLIVSVAVAWLQSGEIGFTGLIAGIFIAGQIIEANILSPRLLGKSVGMHPLWILFALMAGGSLFGITGMLLAVPVTAAIGVLLSYAIEQYKASKLYSYAPKPAEKKAKA